MVFTGTRLVTVREYNPPHLFSLGGEGKTMNAEEVLKRRKHSEGTVKLLNGRIEEKQAREEYGLTEEEIEIWPRSREGEEK